MGSLKSKSIKALLEGIDEYERTNQRIKGSRLNSIQTLYETLLNTDDKKQRDRISAEFRKRSLEFAEFLNNNPDVVNAETEKALLFAAVGGEYNEEEISFDSKGRKKIKHSKKRVLPDVSAIKELRKMLGNDDSDENKLVKAWIEAVTGGDDNGE